MCPTFAGLGAAQHLGLVVSVRAVCVAVAAVAGGDAVLLGLALTLVLPRLAVAAPRLHQHLAHMIGIQYSIVRQSAVLTFSIFLTWVEVAGAWAQHS